MDQIDLKILDALQRHSEFTTADLAEFVGLSPTPIWRRLKKLELAGYFAGKAVLLNPKALGLNVNIFAELRLKQQDEETLIALEAAVLEQREIVECFSVSGEADYLLRVMTWSIEAYESFLKKTLLHLPGVAAINSTFALGCVKITTVLPIRFS